MNCTSGSVHHSQHSDLDDGTQARLTSLQFAATTVVVGQRTVCFVVRFGIAGSVTIGDNVVLGGQGVSATKHHHPADGLHRGRHGHPRFCRTAQQDGPCWAIPRRKWAKDRRYKALARAPCRALLRDVGRSRSKSQATRRQSKTVKQAKGSSRGRSTECALG